MVTLKELDPFVKEYGKEGLSLLILFCHLKSKYESDLRQRFGLDEEELNRTCMEAAKKCLNMPRDSQQKRNRRVAFTYQKK
jgi:hypothetical protein